mgnify:CR=1 FL=1
MATDDAGGGLGAIEVAIPSGYSCKGVVNLTQRDGELRHRIVVSLTTPHDTITFRSSLQTGAELRSEAGGVSCRCLVAIFQGD